MEIIPCDLCGSQQYQPLIRRRDRFSGELFTLVQCSECGLIYLNPRPTAAEIGSYYPESYEAYQTGGASAIDQLHQRHAFDLRLNFIQQYQASPGRLLDVGCATGEFLNRAREKGWKVTGIEYSDPAAKIARERYNLDVRTGELTDLNAAEGTYDVITLWDVLEHVPSPTQALRHAHRLLAPNGHLFFSIPNLESFDRAIFQDYWIGWDVPRHFNLFSQPLVERLLDSTGFCYVGRSCLLGGKGAFLLSLDLLYQDRKEKQRIRHFFPFISLALWPYRRLAYLVKRGPIVDYVARARSEERLSNTKPEQKGHSN